MDSCNDTLAGGLPHSDVHGSKPARGSPWLFAACHVLHRLLVPRHPPNALIILRSSRRSSLANRQTTRIRQPTRPAPPCTETIVRVSRQSPVAGFHRRPPSATGTIVPFGSQSSSAQNPDFRPFLEENGASSGSIHTTPLNPRCPI